MKHASVDRAKRVSSQCRNHGSCPWCQRSRTISAKRVAGGVAIEAQHIVGTTTYKGRKLEFAAYLPEEGHGIG